MTVKELIESLEKIEDKERLVGFAYWTEEDDDLDSRLRIITDGVYIQDMRSRSEVVLQSRY